MARHVAHVCLVYTHGPLAVFWLCDLARRLPEWRSSMSDWIASFGPSVARDQAADYFDASYYAYNAARNASSSDYLFQFSADRPYDALIAIYCSWSMLSLHQRNAAAGFAGGRFAFVSPPLGGDW